MTSLRREDWQRVRALFERALEVPPGQRDTFIADVSALDDSLRQRVRALLESHDQASEFLERPPAVPLAGRPPQPDLSGAQVGPYHLEARIGIGGMGQVYRARDTRLQRTVAIKVLSSLVADEGPARERFELEALAVAALSHPNICTLYDVGVEDLPTGGGEVHYLVMEFLDGETLAERLARGVLSVPEALEQAIQIAHALECAHGAGIVHRDLKPGNIMLTPSGAKLLDFGLAKASAPVTAGGSSNCSGPLTAPGTIIGTLHYMAPEQLEGLDADARADLFAFGCVLYETLTCRKAFDGRSPAALLTAIMASEPAPARAYAPLVPDDLADIIAKCLAKEPDRRWQSARDLRVALQRTARAVRSSPPFRWRRFLPPLRYGAASVAVGSLLLAGVWVGVTPSRDQATPSPQIATTQIAVLPLRMVGGAAGRDEHLSVGIADSIITRLAAVRQIGLRPTAAVLRFVDDSATPARVAAVLGVDNVLVGTIQPGSSAYRVSLQLVRGVDGTVAWARTYDLAPSGLLSFQDTIAEQVVDALRLELTPVERDRLRRPHTTNAEAYDLYLRGRASLVQYSEAGMTTAIDAFERAIAIDPQFGLARAGLATACAWFSIRYAYETDALQWGERADREARAALTSNASAAEATLAIASAAGTLYGGFNWSAVIDGATRALALDPTLDLGHVVLMRAFFHMGLFERMAEEAADSRRLDPLGNVEIARLEVAASLFSGAYQRAREHATALLGRTDAPVIRNYLGLAQFYSGDVKAARETLASVTRGGRPDVRSQAALAGVEAAAGDRIAATSRALAIEQGPYMDHHVAFSLGAAWAQLGEASASVKWLQRSADTGFPSYPWVVRDPMLDPVRTSPEFVGFLERLRRRHEGLTARYNTAP